MPELESNATIKLQAIKEKDCTKIVLDEVYLPFLGKPANVSVIDDWLAIRIRAFEYVEKTSKDSVLKEIEGLTNTLCPTCRVRADVKDVSHLDPCGAQDYGTLCKIWIYQFSLGLR